MPLLLLIVLCSLRGFAADTADEQRARQLLQIQRNGQTLTVEERKFLQHVRQQLGKPGAAPASQRPGNRTPNAAVPRASEKVGGGSYYIAPTGQDTNTGAVDSPWATVAHALTQLLPGDTPSALARNSPPVLAKNDPSNL